MKSTYFTLLLMNIASIIEYIAMPNIPRSMDALKIFPEISVQTEYFVESS